MSRKKHCPEVMKPPVICAYSSLCVPVMTAELAMQACATLPPTEVYSSLSLKRAIKETFHAMEQRTPHKNDSSDVT